MRIVIEAQREIGQISIEEIVFDKKSRDDLPVVLQGLQSIYMDAKTREKIFKILEEGVAPTVNHKLGRPGMPLWNIFVLGVVKQAINCDFDRLTSLANGYRELRQMLGHSDGRDKKEKRYHVQTVIDNVHLLSEEVMGKVNAAVVAHGHACLSKKKQQEKLRCRVDSAVTRTHVEWPTDVRLLRDAMRCLVREVTRMCHAHNRPGWRKEAYWLKVLQRRFQAVRTSRGWRRRKRVQAYLKLCMKLVKKVLSAQQALGTDFSEEGAYYLACSVILTDQVERRLLKGEKIPHAEKIFSIHEPHTRWIVKGKAGVRAELGLPVCLVEDQHQYILHYEVLYEGTDQGMIVEFLRTVRAQYPTLFSCSMDKGYSSVANRKALEQVLDLVIMPKRGKLSRADKERESDPAFVEGRRQHPAVESTMNNGNHRGLDLVRTHGKEGFGRTVALSVVAANVHRVGLQERRKEERLRRWHKARKRAA